MILILDLCEPSKFSSLLVLSRRREQRTKLVRTDALPRCTCGQDARLAHARSVTRTKTLLGPNRHHINVLSFYENRPLLCVDKLEISQRNFVVKCQDFHMS